MKQLSMLIGTFLFLIPAVFASDLDPVQAIVQQSESAPVVVDAEQKKIEDKKKYQEERRNRKIIYPEIPKPPKDVKLKKKELKGTVGVRIPTGLSVGFDQDRAKGSSSDMWVEFHKNMAVTGANSFADFKTGDTVTVKYLESEKKDYRYFTGIHLVKKMSADERQAIEFSK